MIRDRLVIVRIRDSTLSERMQLNVNLTLDEAVKQIRQWEVVHEHQKEIWKGDSKHHPIVVDAVREKRTRCRPPPIGKQSTTTVNAGRAAKPGKKNCSRCGGSPHTMESCPAYNATCRRCRKKGHYTSMCFSNPHSTTGAIPWRLTPWYGLLGHCWHLHRTDEQRWCTGRQWAAVLDSWSYSQLQSVTVSYIALLWSNPPEECNVPVTFKLDTGAEVTAISDTVHRTLNAPLE